MPAYYGNRLTILKLMTYWQFVSLLLIKKIQNSTKLGTAPGPRSITVGQTILSTIMIKCQLYTAIIRVLIQENGKLQLMKMHWKIAMTKTRPSTRQNYVKTVPKVKK